eukprot:TRINITY_DN19_c0_g1_i4.p2 TRINITY_DN19_c0_g1~~TRINITY_DN19_c0_g1_i4.p2  ORF type:complete len:266 (+),score=94.29 TRINITY_DN19_c0_g1_i4:26-799(+)
MARGPRKHLKALAAPKNFMLGRLHGVWAPRPSSGPHKLRECLPLVVMLRNRLKLALTKREVTQILMQRYVKVDGKVRTDSTFPAGFMDVVSITKTDENFRLLYDTKGRFALHKIKNEESKFKLCRVRRLDFVNGGIPTLSTHDGRTFRYPNPAIAVNDSVKVDLQTGEIVDFIKFEIGNVCMITGGHNIGRVGAIVHREKHQGSFEIVHLKDVAGHEYATRLNNVFVIGTGNKPTVSIPRGNGIKLSIMEEMKKRQA